MVDMPWDVFSFWSALGPGWGNKGSQKLCWWKEKVGEVRPEGTREAKEMQKEL